MKYINKLIALGIIGLLAMHILFVQANPSTWAKKEVDRATKLNFIPIEIKNNFQKDITREEFCTLFMTFLERFMYYSGEDIGILFNQDFENPFVDTQNPYVIIAVQLDIVNGVDQSHFNPQGFITRQEAAVLIRNFCNLFLDTKSNTNLISFADQNDIAPWALPSVQFVYQKKIMSGIGNNLFAPKDHYTREQSIMTTMNVLYALTNTKATDFNFLDNQNFNPDTLRKISKELVIK